MLKIFWDASRVYRQMVVLVSFADCDFSMRTRSGTYHAMFNGPGYNQLNDPGCVADYFRDQSGGLFQSADSRSMDLFR